MIYAREIAADVGFKHLTYFLRHDLHAQSLQRMMWVSTRSEAVTAIEEICFKYGFQNARYCPLQQPVRGSWNSQRPRPDLARPFGYLDPPNRRCVVGAFLEPCTDCRDLRFQFVAKLLSALPINARCRSPVHHSPSLLEEFRRQQVRQ